MPEPQWHLLLAPVVYRLASRRGNRRNALVATVASVLIDADHFVDMAYYRSTGDRHRQLVPLHSWELVTVLLGSRSRVARSIGLGFLAHYLVDVVVGDYPARNLSILYRALRRFRTGYLGDWVLWPHGTRGFRELFHSDVVNPDVVISSVNSPMTSAQQPARVVDPSLSPR